MIKKCHSSLCSAHAVDSRLVYVSTLTEVCHFVILYADVGTTDIRLRLLIRDEMATDKLAVCVGLVTHTVPSGHRCQWLIML
jgi:hypothetical protein